MNNKFTPLFTAAEVLVAFAVLYRLFRKANAAWRARHVKSDI